MARSELAEVYEVYYQILLKTDPYRNERIQFSADDYYLTPINLDATYTTEMQHLLADPFNIDIPFVSGFRSSGSLHEMFKACTNILLESDIGGDRAPFLHTPDKKPIRFFYELKKVWEPLELNKDINDWILVEAHLHPDERSLYDDIEKLPRGFLQNPRWFVDEEPYDSDIERLMCYILKRVDERLVSLKKHFASLQDYFASEHRSNLEMLAGEGKEVQETTQKGATERHTVVEASKTTGDLCFKDSTLTLDTLDIKLLDILNKDVERTIPKNQLMTGVWGDDPDKHPFEQELYARIGNLKKAFKTLSIPATIENVYGRGYKLGAKGITFNIR